MFGLLARLALGAMAVAAVGAIIIYVCGKITQSKIEDKLREKGVEEALIRQISNCDNTVTLEDFCSDQKFEIHGDGIGDDIYEGQRIYA